jgi:hypothetical protein
MWMFNIDDAGKKGLEALPETGMGFQFVEAMVTGDLKRLLVFNRFSRSIPSSRLTAWLRRFGTPPTCSKANTPGN